MSFLAGLLIGLIVGFVLGILYCLTHEADIDESIGGPF